MCESKLSKLHGTELTLGPAAQNFALDYCLMSLPYYMSVGDWIVLVQVSWP